MKQTFALALMLLGALLTQAKDELLPPPRPAVIEGKILPPPRIYADFDISEYKSPAQAKTTTIMQRGNQNRASAAQPPYLGIQLAQTAGDLRIAQVDSESPASKSGLKPGDAVTAVDDKPIANVEAFRDAVMLHAPGDRLKLKVNRDSKEQKFSVALAPVSTPFTEKVNGGRRGGSWDNRIGGSFRRSVYRLAAVLIAFPDVPTNSKITPKDWDRSLFSKDVYFDKSVTGQQVYGSMNDYYQEQSCGQLRVEGKVFQPVAVSKKRIEYANSSSRTALLGEAVDRLRARDGQEALQGFDGICFIYAGDTAATQRSSLYWPHRATFAHKNERWSYFIVPEGGARMNNISTICHEFGHMLGLPDLYAKPEVPGMEGLGSWCAMSQQNRGGRPQHFCAWSKEQLGWIKPAIIDPAVPQKLILSPVEGSADQCFKVLMRPDGSEYLLLEIRTKSGFDKDLQGEGLLIWHVTDNRPLLEESHGIAGPAGPRSFPAAVPYPSKANTSFTPHTTPSSMPYKLGGKPVFITNIRRLPDGKITFQIGYEYL